jgi:thioredoxin 1
MVKSIKSSSDFKALFDGDSPKKGKQLVVVDFHAAWCGPCKTAAPKFAELADANPDVAFVKVDVDDAASLAQQYHVQAMPTFLILKNERSEVARVVGANIDALKSKLASARRTL